ncbi:MAG: BON domain-containing protein [Candidatus Promineifilaceae bacterium]
MANRYDRDFDDYDRYNRDRFGYGQRDWRESEYDDYGRGYRGYEGESGLDWEQGGYGQGRMQGDYARGMRAGRGAGSRYMQDDYARGQRGRANWGQSDWREDDDRRGRYGGSQSGWDFDDYDRNAGQRRFGGRQSDWGQTRFEPTSWSYTEYWLIPGPMSGMGPEGWQRSDERIKEDVNERLTQHGRLDAHAIQVDVKDCIVSLRGQVPDRRMKRMAEDTAEAVMGVHDVRNELRLEEQRPGQQSGQTENGRRRRNQRQTETQTTT